MKIKFTRREAVVARDPRLTWFAEIRASIAEKLEGTRFWVEAEDPTIPTPGGPKAFYIYRKVDWSAVIEALKSGEIEVTDDP